MRFRRLNKFPSRPPIHLSPLEGIGRFSIQRAQWSFQSSQARQLPWSFPSSTVVVGQRRSASLFRRCPGGAKIYGIFDYQLPSALRKLPFDYYLSVQNVRKVVYQADGYQPHLIAPEQGYRRLIDGALCYFRGPSEASVDAVHFILKELVRKSVQEILELKRFPTLCADIVAAADQALERFRDESKRTVLRMVDMESSYLTLDFFRKLPQKWDTNWVSY